MKRRSLARYVSLALLAAPMLIAAAADWSLTRDSEKRAFRVSLHPPEPAPPINVIHTWRIVVTTLEGKPIREAKIAVDGGMPDHGHGLPTRPQVNRQVADGVYLLEGMKFSMTGIWEIRLTIQTADTSDVAVFNTRVEHAKPRTPLAP